MELLHKLYRAGLCYSSGRITCERLLQILLRTYLLNVKKIQDGKLYSTQMEIFISCLPSLRALQ